MCISNFPICSLRGKRHATAVGSAQQRRLIAHVTLFGFFRTLTLKFSPNPKINSSPLPLFQIIFRPQLPLTGSRSRDLLLLWHSKENTAPGCFRRTSADAQTARGYDYTPRSPQTAWLKTGRVEENRRDPSPNVPSAWFDRDEIWSIDAKFSQLLHRRQLIDVLQVQRIKQAARLLTVLCVQIKQTEARWDWNRAVCSSNTLGETDGSKQMWIFRVDTLFYLPIELLSHDGVWPRLRLHIKQQLDDFFR